MAFVPLYAAPQVHAFTPIAVSPRLNRRPLTNPYSLHSSPAATTVHLSSVSDLELPLVPFAVISSIILLGAAQSWINFLLRGESGLGAFLSDGSGYNKSGFKSQRKMNDMDDPLPWLKLPRFDYVDVAGQPKLPSMNESSKVVSKMEDLKEAVRIKIEEGDLVAAKQVEMELESLMTQEGYEFLNQLE